MKTSRFTEEQIIEFLRQAQTGMPVKYVFRSAGYSDATFYKWRAKFGGMEASDAARLPELEAENAKLKMLLPEQRRVHAPFPAARAARRPASHPALRPAGQREPPRQSGRRARTTAAAICGEHTTRRCRSPRGARRAPAHLRVQALRPPPGPRRDPAARRDDPRASCSAMTAHTPQHCTFHRPLARGARCAAACADRGQGAECTCRAGRIPAHHGAGPFMRSSPPLRDPSRSALLATDSPPQSP